MTVGCNGLLGTGPGRALSNIRSVEVEDAPTGWGSVDDQRAPGDYGPCPCIEGDDGEAVSSALCEHVLWDEMHVLRPGTLLPQLVEEGNEGCADGVSTDELGRSGIERKEGGGVGIEEVREGIDVRVVKRGNKGMEHLLRAVRREGSARCARPESEEYNSQGRGASEVHEADSSGA